MAIAVRGLFGRLLDFITFPIRALALHEYDKWGLSSLKSERFYHVARMVTGRCLDVGCGRHNMFVEKFLGGNGAGIDVYPYDGLRPEQVVENLASFPFEDGLFDTVTFIANINHVPKPMRDAELAEAFRCLKPGGNIVVTMGNPLAEVVVHKMVEFYDKRLGTNFDVDSERGMQEEEEYYLLDSEIRSRLVKAGFTNIKKKYFLTQWCMNYMFVGWKNS